MSTPVLIYVTTDTKENADHISNALVKGKLVAATQVHSITSTYWWEGKIVSKPEYVLTLKTLDRQYSSIRDQVYSLHNYDLPPIEMIIINTFEPAYLHWLQNNVA